MATSRSVEEELKKKNRRRNGNGWLSIVVKSEWCGAGSGGPVVVAYRLWTN